MNPSVKGGPVAHTPGDPSDLQRFRRAQQEIAGKRAFLGVFLALTFILGFIFVYLQAVEYIEAYQHLNLKLTTGIYGSTFFMLTGFHGMHVTIGAIMLTIIWLRVVKGHFTPDKHFAFEAVAWYWHFVDVVWVALYVFVYWM